jgi:hypothetical protein
MTDTYVKQRVEDLRRVALSLLEEATNPDSRGAHRRDAVLAAVEHIAIAQNTLLDTIHTKLIPADPASSATSHAR